MLELVLFYIFAAIALISAILVITQHNVVHSAAFLGATLFAVAGIFLTLHAEFLAGVVFRSLCTWAEFWSFSFLSSC